jgi:hypothetical protein
MADLTMFRANDKTWTLTFKDSDDVPINIYGSTILLTVKKNANDPDSSAIITKRVTTHIDATSGVSAITVTKTDSAKDVGNYVYDMKLIDSAGDNTTIPGGSFFIKRDITRATS